LITCKHSCTNVDAVEEAYSYYKYFRLGCGASVVLTTSCGPAAGRKSGVSRRRLRAHSQRSISCKSIALT
jgi:hypothetical protein